MGGAEEGHPPPAWEADPTWHMVGPQGMEAVFLSDWSLVEWGEPWRPGLQATLS
jgi:hypothetical protein